VRFFLALLAGVLLVGCSCGSSVRPDSTNSDAGGDPDSDQDQDQDPDQDQDQDQDQDPDQDQDQDPDQDQDQDPDQDQDQDQDQVVPCSTDSDCPAEQLCLPIGICWGEE